MNYNEIDWLKRNSGKFVIRQAKILVRKVFETREAAETWAKTNYRTNNWHVERAG